MHCGIAERQGMGKEKVRDLLNLIKKVAAKPL
jgi:hypothetical protein